MCTLTWRARADASGYELWFNRDEVITRAPELEPRLWAGDGAGAVFLAPVDGGRGGTWLAVNERGMTVALLNDYGVTWRPPAPSRSRGDVAVEAARAGGIREVSALLSRAGLRNTAAFTLVALESGGGRACWHWDGADLEERRGAGVPEFLSSSSYRTETVIEERKAGFLRAKNEAKNDGALRAYHFFHDEKRGAESVLMCRPDANTRSVCSVKVGGTEAVLDYVPVVRSLNRPVAGETRRWTLPLSGGVRV